MLAVGNERSPNRTSRLKAPMPVQAAHCCADKACVWNQGPPNCTMTT